jgi:serine/threonine protein kinase
MREFTPGEEFAGHRIEGVAGQGGMGIVYRATDLRLKRVVALKLISSRFADDPEFRRRFERESELAASIRHPNVITVYSAGEHEGSLFITMDLIEGTDLREMIATYGALEPGFAATLVSQVAGALDAAHQRGLIHRDVKPANIVLGHEDGEYRAYLTDFGLTKRGGEVGNQESGLTQAGSFVGTLDYIAPEQLKGEPVDARTDVYSLGCVFYQAITGQVPYPRPSEPAKMWAHVGEPPPTLQQIAPHLAPNFESVVQKGMAKDPNHRYQSAGELGKQALEAAGVGGEVPPPDPPKSNRPLIFALAGGALALVAIAVVLALSLGGDDSGSNGPTPGFTGKVAAICKDRKAQISAYATQLQDLSQGDSSKAAELLGNLHDAVAGLRDQLAGLTPPDDQADGYKLYLKDLGELADAVTAEQNAISSGDAAGAQSNATRVSTIGTKADQDGAKVEALKPCATG